MKPVKLLTRSRFYASLFSTVVLNLRPFVWLRGACAPGMNCHGCALATGACPVGVFAFGSAMHALPALALGTILAIGIVFGRLACAFACPFGLLQDLLHRIPGPKLSLPRWWRWGKYAALVLLVVALPFLLGFRVEPFLVFAKPTVDQSGSDIVVQVTVRNPSPEPVAEVAYDLVWKGADGGELERLPQRAAVAVAPGARAELPPVSIPNRLAEAELAVASPLAELRQDPGLHYYCTTCPVGTLEAVVPTLVGGEAPAGYLRRNGLRLGILAGFLVLMWLASRPFCRGFCPLGAIYGLTARAAISRIALDASHCIDCGACRRACPAELDVPKEVGGPECIACGDCITACPEGGIHRRFGFRSP